ncbi:unnamed protein product, partial [Tetraodon nigroviridis]
QPLSQVAGAQVKKKSGFQITSVTSAQINVSGNNSLADDTESYDDLDESHTEDLSSDMLDVSVPRTMDTGVPERSSSDETLNSLHGVETPGLGSPNEPLQPHPVPHQQASMEVVGGAPAQKPGVPLAFAPAAPQTVVGPPPPGIAHQLASVVDPHQAEVGYGAAPQLHAGLMAVGGVRPPDFIQPTAPFQTQVQSLQPHLPAGPPGSPVPAPSAATQPLPNPRPAQAAFTGPPQSLPAQMPAHPLPAVLQPLLTPGALPHGAVAPSKSSQLEDAQKLLFQHQGLLGLPRLAGGEGTLEAVAAVGTLAHMGMSAEASAFMAAAAAGFRAQHEGGED